MSSYNEEFNTDNVILRYILVATLAELKNKVYFYNQVDEDTSVKVEVPFLPSITGNERMLMDLFKFNAEKEAKAIGDYEVVPRGMVQLTGLSIDSGSQTNKYVRSEFVREYDGQLKTFSLQTAYVPINMSFDITVTCSDQLEMFKVTESVISKLYKVNYFQVDLGMMRVEGSFEVSEDYAQNRLYEFGLSDKKEFEVTFPLEVKSFMPVFEGGILLSELVKMIKDTPDNPDRDGIGMLRDGEIRFGGVIQKAVYTVDDLNKAPGVGVWSNLKIPPAIDSLPFLDGEVDSAIDPQESAKSKEFRNTDKDKETNS